MKRSLLQITRHAYDVDFRKQLLIAAAAAGDVALHIQCQRTQILTIVRPEATEVREFSSLQSLKEEVVHLIAETSPLILTGVGGAFAPKVEDVLRLFPRSRRFYDVQDDLSYGATSLAYLKFMGRDMRWRWLCGRTIILEEGMKRYYPNARHLDNASHIVSGTARQESQIKAVYVGSIDQRLDIPMITALSLKTPVDIYGRFHEDAGSAEAELISLSRKSNRIRLFGPYDNANLSEILRSYSIGLAPYKVGHRMTQHVNPDKIYHYLNAGLGVVTTAIPQALRMSTYLGIISDPEKFDEVAGIALVKSRSWNSDQHTWAQQWNLLRSYVEA